jgi:hypothetical protein
VPIVTPRLERSLRTFELLLLVTERNTHPNLPVHLDAVESLYFSSVVMDFDIVKIPRDDDSARQYVDCYKAFRLLALQTAPDMFGSTYERETALTNDEWLARLTSLSATTFLATQENKVIGTITTVGPLPFLPDE